MCSSWTLPKLLSCRPCFSQYDSPSGVELETVPSAEVSNRSMLNRKAAYGETGFVREPIDGTLMSTGNGLPNKNRKYELHWHHGFKDEHYIVFCFGEEESVDREEDDCDKLEALAESGNRSEGLNTDSPEDEEGESSVGITKTECNAKDEERIESVSIGSRNSDQSDGSNGRASKGSFSFPVLHREWIGSPVQMPTLQDFYSRNNSDVLRMNGMNFELPSGNLMRERPTGSSEKLLE